MPDLKKIEEILKTNTFKTRIIQGADIYNVEKLSFYLSNNNKLNLKEYENLSVMGINDNESRYNVLEWEEDIIDETKKNNEDTKKNKDLENEIDIIYKLSKNHYYIFEYNDTMFVVYLKNDNDVPTRLKHRTDVMTSMYIYFNNTNDVFEKLCIESYLYYENNYLKIDSCREDLSIYVKTDYGFDKTNSIKQKKINTLYLPKKQINDLIKDFTYFLENEKLYTHLDINYKRCYLFEGIWGSGKTSTIRTLASKFKYNIAIIAFDASLTDTKFFEAIREIPNNSILVLEDIDCLFQERKKNDENKNMLTFSSILNSLDGMLSKHGLITIMTTNYKIHLDKALIRPGRVDYIMHFDYMKKTEIKQMYLKFMFINEELDKTSKKISEKEKNAIFDKFYQAFRSLQIKLTASLFQQYLWIYVNDFNGSIDNIDKLKDLYDQSNLDTEKNLYM